MIHFPESTKVGLKIPKEKFYANMEMTADMKRRFINLIDHIIWQYKLSGTTLNVGKGSMVIEIDVFGVYLKIKDINTALFDFIEQNFPRHTLFILIYEEEAKLLVSYKEPITNRPGKFKILEKFQTSWMPMTQLELTIDGLNMDQVYESLVKQIGKIKVERENPLRIGQSILNQQTKEKLQKQILLLEKKMHNEKQFNIQLKISNEIKSLEKELTKIGK
ncbi:MAG: DUF4391 domain-containing protein [Bacteroidales bacterium]|nr:DUF4391 domain-containing protein [Bacteroidales bacterium]